MYYQDSGRIKRRVIHYIFVGTSTQQSERDETSLIMIKSPFVLFSIGIFLYFCTLLGNALVEASYSFFTSGLNVLGVCTFVSLLGHFLKLVCKIVCKNICTPLLVIGTIVLKMLGFGTFLSEMGIILLIIGTILLMLGKIVLVVSKILLVVDIIVAIFMLVCFLFFVPRTIRLEDITPGTILKHPRFPNMPSWCVVYYHHEIVIDVDYTNETFTVIGLQTPTDKQFWSKLWDICSAKKAEIVEKKQTFKDIAKNCKFEKVPNSKIAIERAENCLQTQEINGITVEYSAAFLNCEHVVNYFKTGILESAQVDKFHAFIQSRSVDYSDILVVFFCLFVCLSVCFIAFLGGSLSYLYIFSALFSLLLHIFLPSLVEIMAY